MRAIDTVPGDLIEIPWDGSKFRVVNVKPSTSGKIVNIRGVVEVSGTSGLYVGKTMNFGRRAATTVWIQRPPGGDAETL